MASPPAPGPQPDDAGDTTRTAAQPASRPPATRHACPHPAADDGFVYAELIALHELGPEHAVLYAQAQGFLQLRAMLRAVMCFAVAGDPPPGEVMHELMLHGPEFSRPLLIGRDWIGDGRHHVQIDPQTFDWLDRFFRQRRESGPHISREDFERRYADAAEWQAFRERMIERFGQEGITPTHPKSRHL